MLLFHAHTILRTTQELATWALGESPSSRTLESHGHSSSDTEAEGRQKPGSVFSDSEQGEPRDSLDSSRPGVIEEVSEPVSPEEHEDQAAKPPAIPSALSHLLRSDAPKSRGHLAAGPSGSYTTDGRPSSPGVVISDIDAGEITESTSLLPRARLPEPTRKKWKDAGYAERQWAPVKGKWATFQYELGSTWKSMRNPKEWNLRHASSVALGAVAAVFLGLLLNVLDALSYGMFADLSSV